MMRANASLLLSTERERTGRGLHCPVGEQVTVAISIHFLNPSLLSKFSGVRSLNFTRSLNLLDDQTK